MEVKLSRLNYSVYTDYAPLTEILCAILLYSGIISLSILRTLLILRINIGNMTILTIIIVA